MSNAGIPRWYIESLQKINYLFPRAHAVTYVMSAYRIAWYKVHHPLAFYSAYFDRQRRKCAFDPEMMCCGLNTVISSIERLHNVPDDACADDLLTTLEVCCEFYKRGLTFTLANRQISIRTGFSFPLLWIYKCEVSFSDCKAPPSKPQSGCITRGRFHAPCLFQIAALLRYAGLRFYGIIEIQHWLKSHSIKVRDYFARIDYRKAS